MEIWLIVIWSAVVLQFVAVYFIHRSMEPTSHQRRDSSARHDPSRASWTGSVMQDAMDGGE